MYKLNKKTGLRSFKGLIYLVLFLFLIISVVGVKPVATQIEIGADLLAIEYIKNPYLTVADSITLHFHVFNSTGVPRDNTTTSCIIHVYNSTQSHILIQTAKFDDVYDFEVVLGSNITTVVGYYQYIFQCSPLEQGGEQYGFISDYFEITDTTEKEKDVNGSILAVMILLPILFGLMLLIGSLSLNPEEHPVLRIFLMLLSFMTYLISSWLGVINVIRYYNFDELQNSTVTSVWIAGIMIGVIIIYFLIYAFYKGIHASAQKQKEMMLQ
jgi:hypothetical protein